MPVTLNLQYNNIIIVSERGYGTQDAVIRLILYVGVKRSDKGAEIAGDCMLITS